RAAGRAAEARQALQQVARLRSSIAVPQGTASVRREQPFDRAGLFRQLAGVAPLFPASRYAEAWVRLEKGDYGAAIEALAREVPVDRAPGESPRVKGLESWVAGDHNAALRELRQAIDARPGD